MGMTKTSRTTSKKAHKKMASGGIICDSCKQGVAQTTFMKHKGWTCSDCIERDRE